MSSPLSKLKVRRPTLRGLTALMGLGFNCSLPVLATPANVEEMDRNYWPTTQWITSAPEDQGMSSAVLSRLVDFGKPAQWDSLLVVRHGRIVTEAYYAPFKAGSRHALNSATKSVIGTLIGIVIQKGLLDSVDHPVMDLFSERKIAGVDERKKALTVKSLLDMTSGLSWTEPLTGIPETVWQMKKSPDWVQFVLDRPMAEPPRTVFNYNSGNAHLLSAVLTQMTGRSALPFAREELFGPLGIADVSWESDPQGNSTGGGGLYLQPRDMAKLGYLYLKNGVWEKKQILPSAWLDEVKSASVDMQMMGRSDFHYANLFWTFPRKHCYMAVGFNSQIIMVLPDLDVVAVTTGRAPPQFLKLIDSIAESVKSDGALPPAPAEFSALQSRITFLAK